MQGLGRSGLEGLLFPNRIQRVESLCLEVELKMTEGSVAYAHIQVLEHTFAKL